MVHRDSGRGESPRNQLRAALREWKLKVQLKAMAARKTSGFARWLVALIGGAMFPACDNLAGQLETPFAPVEQYFRVEKPALPAPPLPPRMTPCPSGWREAQVDDVTACEPWPEAGYQTCGIDSAHFPGTPGCSRVGSECPTDGWTASLPTGQNVLYVRQGAPAGGSGTQSAPFASLDAALSQASPGSVVALAAGTYSTVQAFPPGVSLFGACVAQTTLTTPQPDASILKSTTANVRIQNLRISGPFVGLDVRGGDVTLRDVIFDQTAGSAIFIRGGARLDAERIVIRNTTPFPNASGGRGVQIQDAVFEARGLVIESNRENAFIATGAAARVHLVNAAIRDTLYAANGNGGEGVVAANGARVELEASVVERSHSFGVRGVSGSEITLTDVIVRDTQPLPVALPSGEVRGFGIWTQDGNVKGNRVRVERNAGAGVLAFGGATSRISLTDLIVRDTVWADGAAVGVTSDFGATLELERAVIQRCRPYGFFAFADTVSKLTDVSVLDTSVDADGNGGGAIAFSLAKQAVLQRIQMNRNQWVGLTAYGIAQLTGADISVTDSLPDAQGKGAMSILLGKDVGGSLERVRVERALSAGVTLVSATAKLSMNDFTIADVRPDPKTGLFGYGLVVREGASLKGTRGAIQSTHRGGIYGQGQGTKVTLSQMSVRSVSQGGCEVEPCRAAGGVIVTDSASVDLSQFLVSGSEGFGVLLAYDGQLDLHQGEVSHHPIAAGVLVDGYALDRLDDGVTYRDNGQKLSASFVPLPELPPVPEFRRP